MGKCAEHSRRRRFNRIRIRIRIRIRKRNLISALPESRPLTLIPVAASWAAKNDFVHRADFAATCHAHGAFLWRQPFRCGEMSLSRAGKGSTFEAPAITRMAYAQEQTPMSHKNTPVRTGAQTGKPSQYARLGLDRELGDDHLGSSTDRTASETASAMGFYIWLKEERGHSEAQAQAFEARLETYLQTHHFAISGGPLRAWIYGHAAALTQQDCMNFLQWVARDGSMVHVATTGIQRIRDEVPPTELRVSIAATDPVLDAVLLLYRAHRLNADQALAALDTCAPYQLPTIRSLPPS